MSPRDYKNAARSVAKPAPRRGSWISFISGLGLGLLVALTVYLWRGNLPPPAALISSIGSEEETADEFDIPVIMSDAANRLPRPKFDFYKILPEMEVPVPQWALSGDDDDDEPGLAPGTYVLQVGSFKRFEDADRAKARLALRGISARVQRVVINGQAVWFRVHVGPYSDVSDIRAMRVKLIENDMDFILLRIGVTGTT